MSNYQDKISTRNTAPEDAVDQRANNIKNENVRDNLSNRPNLNNINSASATYNPRQHNLLLNSNDSSQSSNNYKYQSQTVKLVICNKCGKPKRPKGMQEGNNSQTSRKSVIRQIIAEQDNKGGYIIKYAEEQSNHFCPIHGFT